MFMIRRNFWLKRIHELWKKVPIVWLSGVRRVGKTTLVQAIENALYLNCDLPSTQELLKDPESFYASVNKPIVIFDEVHQLPDPSKVLKIGADEYQHLKILATGSSTLAATQKFSDSLTGRKRALHLVPVLPSELADFHVKDLKERLLKGGLPPALLSEERDLEFYAEWTDSFYARDVQELFKVEKRAGFLCLLELLLKDSGGLLNLATLSKHTGLTAPTVRNYLEVLEMTHALFRLRPFHGGGKREIIKQPKYYGFDTGFIAYFNGWSQLRNEDCGRLLENLVLEVLQTIPPITKIHFWRDKQGREVDFVCPKMDKNVDVIECKWKAEAFEIHALQEFRKLYPKGKNIVVSGQETPAYAHQINGIKILFVSIYELAEHLG